MSLAKSAGIWLRDYWMRLLICCLCRFRSSIYVGFRSQGRELVHSSKCAFRSSLQDAIALLRLDDLYVDSFEVKDGW